MSLEEEKKLNQNEWVRWLLNEDHKAELWEILAFWEKCKEEWERMKREFWGKWGWSYKNLLMQYKDSKKKYMENLSWEEKEILDTLNEIWKDKFIEEYIHDKILYSGDKNNGIVSKSYDYSDWKLWKVVMKEWVKLDLDMCGFWDAWAEAISKMELKGWVYLNLDFNHIWDEWAEVLSKMELKEWVWLCLWYNHIWDEWAAAISKMELKEWVKLNLRANGISEEMKHKLRKWAQWYKDNWINCEVIL